jgi:hypothetical protein
MMDKISLEQLTQEIRQAYESDPTQAEALVEAHLRERLRGLSVNERLARLEELAAEFGKTSPRPFGIEGEDDEVLSRLFSLLLGREIYQADLSSTELMERLAVSLNTIFDTLNELVRVINATLLGGHTGEETIRHVIGFHLEGESQSQSLESYIGQIKKAFLTAQQASKKAAYTKVSQVLNELDPERIEATDRGGLKFGPLRKAAFFEIYEDKFRTCKKWLESGRFMDEFLREFEKNCQELYP